MAAAKDAPPDPLADVGREIDALAEIAFPDPDRTEARAALALLDASHFTWEVHRTILAALKEAGPDDDWRDVHRRLRGVLVGEIDVQDYFAQTVSGAQVSNAKLPGITTKLRRLADLRHGRARAVQAAALVDSDPMEAAARALDANHAITRTAEPFARRVDFDLPPLDACIWRDPPPGRPDFRDPALPRRAVGIATGPGKAGKSTIVYGLAAAMNPRHGAYGRAFGLRIRTGPVLVVTWEDHPETVARNARWYDEPHHWDHLHVAHASSPLWAPSPDDHRTCAPTSAFTRLSADARRIQPALVVVDPVAAAFAGAHNNASDVRAFMTLLADFAEDADTSLLLIGHDTKQGRFDFAQLGLIGPGQAQGSSQWTDAARAAFFVARLPKTARAHYPDGAAVVVCTHANVGPSGFGAVIAPREDDQGRFRGFEPEPVELLDDAAARLAELADEAKTAQREEKIDQATRAARQLIDWIKALPTDPDAKTPLADLAKAFTDSTSLPITATLAGKTCRAQGIETKACRIGDKTRKCALGIALP